MRSSVSITKKINRPVDLTAEADNAEPNLRRVAEFQAERTGTAELSRQRSAHAVGVDLRCITEGDVRRMLTTLLEDMRYQQEQGATRQLRETVASVIDKMELDGSAEARNICYRIALLRERRVSLASPAGFEPAYLP